MATSGQSSIMYTIVNSLSLGCANSRQAFLVAWQPRTQVAEKFCSLFAHCVRVLGVRIGVNWVMDLQDGDDVVHISLTYILPALMEH